MRFFKLFQMKSWEFLNFWLEKNICWWSGWLPNSNNKFSLSNHIMKMWRLQLIMLISIPRVVCILVSPGTHEHDNNYVDWSTAFHMRKWEILIRISEFLTIWWDFSKHFDFNWNHRKVFVFKWEFLTIQFFISLNSH